MKRSRSTKFDWTNCFPITRLACLFGVVAIALGIAAPRLYQINIFACVALVGVGLSVIAIPVSLWRIESQSRRWRDLRFWVALVVNLFLIIAVSLLYRRGLEAAPYQQVAEPLPPGQAIP